MKGVRAFIDDLDFLLKHYKPISYDEFRELTRNERQQEKPSFLLSFDDGLKEFYEVIAPILLRKGIPAICFLNSGFIDNKDLFYRYKASLLIDRLITDPKSQKALSAQYQDIGDIISYIYSVKYQNKEILDEMAEKINLDFKTFLATQTPYLNPSQIESLITQGFYFGAHSIDHPEYQYINPDEQIRQTSESIHTITSRFSFPFTDYNVSKSFFEQIKKNKIADHTFGSAGQKKDPIETHFQRIPFDFKTYSAREIHHTELLYYILKMPLGKIQCIDHDKYSAVQQTYSEGIYQF